VLTEPPNICLSYEFNELKTGMLTNSKMGCYHAYPRACNIKIGAAVAEQQTHS